MAAFCVKPELAAKLKEAAKAGEITMQKLFDMSSEDRNALFTKYTDKETAKQINAGFENSMASSQKSVLNNWVKRTFSSAEKKSAKAQDISDKIAELDKLGVLTPEKEKAFLSDLVSTKLGATITSEEAKTISEHAGKLQALSKDVSEFGTPTKEYFKAKSQLNDYLHSLTPSHNLKVLTSTIGRGSMLASFKSPLLNIESNTVQGFLAMAERRIANRSARALNNGYALKYMKFVNDVYKESGYDVSRLEAMGGERKSLGEDFLHSQGKGIIRKIGRVYEDIVFKKLQGAPDVAFSSFHFADSANLKSTLIAKSEGLRGQAANDRALAIFKDATSLDPQSKEGQMTRAQAVADATVATYTNKSLYADIGLGIRKIFNIASGDLRLGDNMMPFVKTPANVLGAGLEHSGVLLPVDTLYRMGKVLNDIHNGVEASDAWKDNFQGFYRSIVRAGLGTTFAYILSSLINPQDFIGAYPTNPKEQALLSEQNGVTNSIKVGNKWVSLDYLGPLGAPLLGMLYAKKYGNSGLDQAFRYYQGVGQTLQNFPGLSQISQVLAVLQNNVPSPTNGVDSAAVGIGKAGLGAIESRLVPGLVNDIAKMTDPYVRSTDKNSITSVVQSQIPGLREGLPIKTDLFGDKQKTEPWVDTLLFGARVKSAGDSKVINELVSLDKQDALPAITNVAKSSTRAKALQSQIGDKKFNEAMSSFGQQLKTDFATEIDSDEYKGFTPEEKQNAFNKIKETDFDTMLDQYGYIKPEKN